MKIPLSICLGAFLLAACGQNDIAREVGPGAGAANAPSTSGPLNSGQGTAAGTANSTTNQTGGNESGSGAPVTQPGTNANSASNPNLPPANPGANDRPGPGSSNSNQGTTTR